MRPERNVHFSSKFSKIHEKEELIEETKQGSHFFTLFCISDSPYKILQHNFQELRCNIRVQHQCLCSWYIEFSMETFVRRIETDNELGKIEGIYRLPVLQRMSTPQIIFIRWRHRSGFHIDFSTGATGWFTVNTPNSVISKCLPQYPPNSRIRGIILTAMNRRRGWHSQIFV